MIRLAVAAFACALTVATVASAQSSDPGHRFPASLAPIYIADIQTVLTDRGYYGGPISGQINGATKAAISLFQHDLGAQITGLADPELVNALHFGPPIHSILSPISTVPEIPPPAPPVATVVSVSPVAAVAARAVKTEPDDPDAIEATALRNLQEILISKGLYDGPADGHPNADTVAALQAYTEASQPAPVPAAPAPVVSGKTAPVMGYLIHHERPAPAAEASPAPEESAADSDEPPSPASAPRPDVTHGPTTTAQRHHIFTGPSVGT